MGTTNSLGDIHPPLNILKLIWHLKCIVGRRHFLLGKAYFQGRLLLVSGRVTTFENSDSSQFFLFFASGLDRSYRVIEDTYFPDKTLSKHLFQGRKNRVNNLLGSTGIHSARWHGLCSSTAGWSSWMCRVVVKGTAFFDGDFWLTIRTANKNI